MRGDGGTQGEGEGGEGRMEGDREKNKGGLLCAIMIFTYMYPLINICHLSQVSPYSFLYKQTIVGICGTFHRTRAAFFSW